MTDSETLNRYMVEEGRKFGYESITAEFGEFSNMVIRWNRTNRWIRISVSDFLEDAPDEIIRSLSHVLFEQICGRRSRYPKELVEWLTAPDFIKNHRQTFIERNAGMSRSTKGEHKDLADSYKRLLDEGLIEDDPEVFITWTNTKIENNYTQYSVLMKTIAVTDLLDDPEVPDYVLDWLIYHDMCVIASGYDPTKTKKTVPTKVAERFDKMYEAIGFLNWFFDVEPEDEGDEDAEEDECEEDDADDEDIKW